MRKNKPLFIVFFFLATLHLSVLAQSKPFPNHTAYAAGSILPASFLQSTMDGHVEVFYDTWKSKYVKAGCQAGHYYVDYDDPHGSRLVTSEGQGYGMMIMAYMAGYDSEAKTIFDGMHQYFKAHPSIYSSYLMGWEQTTNCAFTQYGNRSASDGDIDIAYALLLADAQWGSSGSINYLSEAKMVIQALLDNCVNAEGNVIQLGDFVNNDFYNKKYKNHTRSSDFIPDHFRCFNKIDGNSTWLSITDRIYYIVDYFQTHYSSSTGLISDFITYANATPYAASPNFLENEYDGEYYMNACRFPWRIGTDFLLSGEPRAQAALNKINGWIKPKAGNNPESIRAGYTLSGGSIPGSSYDSPSFIGPLGIASMASADYQSWCNKLYNYLYSYSHSEHGYYENTIGMICMLVMTGNYWTPMDIMLSTDEYSSPVRQITISPNPTQDQLTIKTKINEELVVELLDQQGRLLMSLNNNSEQVQVDLASLPNGIYLIRLHSEGQSAVHKIVKQ